MSDIIKLLSPNIENTTVELVKSFYFILFYFLQLTFNNRSDVQKCCAVSSCNSIMCSGSDESNQMRNNKTMFHKFPTDTVILEKWLKFCNNFKTISHEYQNFLICSKHFNKDNYENKYTNEVKYIMIWYHFLI